MIKLFVSDIDGCICYPFKAPDWQVLGQIRALNEQGVTDPEIPELTLCTGRPLPYVEAAAQWLNVQYPIIFESGGGTYDPKSNTIRWSDAYLNAQGVVDEVRAWVAQEIIDDYEGLMPEFTKRTDVGVVHPDYEVIQQVFPRIREHVMAKYTEFDVHYTEVSVNVILKESNKGNGVEALAKRLGISLEEIAYIGDGTNDIPALGRVGAPFAPTNCRDEVAEIAERLEEDATHAVLKAYQLLKQRNREQIEA